MLQCPCFLGLIGIFKMIYLVSWDFRMNIKSNIRQIHSGIEVFQKEFSYHFHQLVMYALIIKYDISQKCYLHLQEHEGSSGYEKPLRRTPIQQRTLFSSIWLLVPMTILHIQTKECAFIGSRSILLFGSEELSSAPSAKSKRIVSLLYRYIELKIEQ